MAGAASRWSVGEPMPVSERRARIAVTHPASLNGRFLFELVDVDGPQPGRSLGEMTVPQRIGQTWPNASRPDPQSAARVRQQLRVIGQEQGFTVTDY
jgi:hypothetical protein